MKFPDFIIIGAMKCATTVLWHNLNKHPEITMGKNVEDPKKASTEIRFWNNGRPHHTWEKGIDWYKNLFDGICCGEKCANYIEYKAVFAKMYQYIPKVKLILCVRNPVDRAYSEYNMQKTTKRYKDDFTLPLAKKRGYIRRGEYYNQLKNNVLSFFDPSQVYLIVQERMKKDTNKELNNLYDFIGVSKYDLNSYSVAARVATDKELDLVADSKIKNYKVWSSEYKPMTKIIRKQLEEYFKPHNAKLFKFIGNDIPEWR